MLRRCELDFFGQYMSSASFRGQESSEVKVRVICSPTIPAKSLALLRSTVPLSGMDNGSRVETSAGTTCHWIQAEMHPNARPEGNSGHRIGKFCGARLSGCDDVFQSLHNARSTLLAADHCN